MNTKLVFLLLMAIQSLWAQGFKMEMKKLEPLVGQWTGTATYRMGPGEPQVVQQQENIEFKLEGAVLQIEGLGKVGDKIAHHALALVNFNSNETKFNFRSYLSDGKMSDAYFSMPEVGKFVWGFDSPQRKIKYIITIKNNTWLETGEYSTDGIQWTSFIEMNLTKLN